MTLFSSIIILRKEIHMLHRSPKAYITRATTVLGTKPAPFMAAFSSKGPSTMAPEILKVRMHRYRLRKLDFGLISLVLKRIEYIQ